jgi:hypothetical protein
VTGHNFAFLTHSGVPVGPPGPDQQTDATFTPTTDALLMNPGDTIKASLHDTPEGLATDIRDLATNARGSMTASVANGFRHILWDPVNSTCDGRSVCIPCDVRPCAAAPPRRPAHRMEDRNPCP